MCNLQIQCESAWKHISATVKTITSGDITSYKTCCIASSPYFKSTNTHNHGQTGTWKTCCWMFAKWMLHRRTFCQMDHLSICWQTICQGIICWWTFCQMDTIIMANEYYFLHFYRHIHVYLYVLWQIYIWKQENIQMEKKDTEHRKKFCWNSVHEKEDYQYMHHDAQMFLKKEFTGWKLDSDYVCRKRNDTIVHQTIFRYIVLWHSVHCHIIHPWVQLVYTDSNTHGEKCEQITKIGGDVNL